MSLHRIASLLVLGCLAVAACDPETCPSIGGSGGPEAVEDYPEYAAAAAAFMLRAPVQEALEPSAAEGDVQIRVEEVESIDVWRSYECGAEDTVDIGGANVLVEIMAPDGSLTLVIPALVADADTDTPTLRFEAWSSTDPQVLAQLPDADLAEGAQIGRVELELTDTQMQLFRTDMTDCTMVEGCPNTQRHLLLSWANDDGA